MGEIVDPWQLASWESYRDVSRLGRKSRLNEAQRAALWTRFERVRAGLKTRGLMTRAEMFTILAEHMSQARHTPFDFAIIDEAQDVSVPQLRFLAALAAQRPESLFFAGDLGQRIFQAPFSWKSLRVDVRGRSSTLKINYRTSHQIRAQADLLLGPEISDVDGNREERKGTISVFNGPPPDIRALNSNAEENKAVGSWIKERVKEGSTPHEIGIFVRSEAQIGGCPVSKT
jgi:superfamily I DNA/RNA helicase